MVMSVPHEHPSLLVANPREIKKTANGKGVQPIPIGTWQLAARGKTIVEEAELRKDLGIVHAPEIILEVISLRTPNCVTHVGVHPGKKSLRIRCELND